MGSGALHFDGTDDNVEVPFAAPLTLADTDYTISMWLKWAGTNTAYTHQTFATMDSGWNGWTGMYYLHPGSYSLKEIQRGGGAPPSTDEWYVPSDDYYPVSHLNEWTCMTLVYDRNTHNRDLYVNGSHVSSDSTPVTMTWDGSNESLFFGGAGRYDPQLYSYYGDIDDVQIYNQALTASEVATVAAGGVVPNPVTPKRAFDVPQIGSVTIDGNLGDWSDSSEWSDELCFVEHCSR